MFMDNVNFEQYELNNELIGNAEKFYLKEIISQ